MTSLLMPLPTGFTLVPGGVFEGGALMGTPVAEFAMKETPVTNEEWGETVAALDEDTYVLLDHDWETGETKLKNRGKDIQAALNGPVSETILNALQTIQFDLGEVALLGGQILLKMVANPSAQYDQEGNGRIFSGARQPVVGVSYFHAMAWCLLKTITSAGQWFYDLPTDTQFEYVASDKGAKTYGTSTGGLYGPDGKKLVHLDEYSNDRGATVEVDSPDYEPAKERPFGIDTVANILRWTKFNAVFKGIDEYLWGPYGLRGGSWRLNQVFGRAVRRDFNYPNVRYNDAGFSPVINKITPPWFLRP